MKPANGSHPGCLGRPAPRAWRVILGSVVPPLLASWLGAPPVEPARADCGATCSAGNCVFDGVLNQPLGAATLAVDPQCRLVVSNVGGSGQDGVVQTQLGSVYMVTTLATPNFSGSGLGTEAEITQVGVVDGQPGREISLTRILNVTGTLVRLEMSCAAILVPAYSTEVYGPGGLVYAQPPGPDPPVLIFPKADMEAMACALLPEGDLYTTVRFGAQVPVMIQTSSGSLGPFTGDCLKLRGFSPGLVPTLQEAIENRFRNTGPVTILSLYAGPLPASDTVCPDAPVPVRASTWGTLKVRYR